MARRTITVRVPIPSQLQAKLRQVTLDLARKATLEANRVLARRHLTERLRRLGPAAARGADARAMRAAVRALDQPVPRARKGSRRA